MRQILLISAVVLLAACQNTGTPGRCFPVSNSDLLPPVDNVSGRQLVCGGSRIKPGRQEYYRARYPEAFPPRPAAPAG